MNRSKRAWVLALALILMLGCLVLPGGAAAASEPTVTDYPTGYTFTVTSQGRYANWAGVSTVSQFTDAQGNFCFAVDDGSQVTVYKTSRGKVTGTVVIDKPYETFGAAACDGSGNLYMVWGSPNSTDDTAVNTIIVGKYSPAGKLIAEAGGNGSEGMAYYYDERFYTQTPFDGGNCDVAVNGSLLLVNYARHMYSGHQANTVFVVDTSSMQVQTGIISYNSHSFDQRATAWSKTGGFLLASQGDCFPRSFTTSVTDRSKTLNEMETFHFWVQQGAYDAYDMYKLNATRSRLGNILESGSGAVLVGSSVRSLSEDALSEPKDVFVQVFDPRGSASSASSFVTGGTRSGLAGKNGDEQVTDYGVSWLTDLADSGMTVDVVQAVNAWEGRIAVLYELSDSYGSYDSTWCMILNENGSVYRSAFSLGQVRLNTDEDPVFAQDAVQWVSNAAGSGEVVLHSLGYTAAKPGEIASVTAEAAPGKITVRWSAASDADAYLLQRRVTGSSTWTTLASAASGVSYRDTTGVAGTVYQYRVRGRNEAGYGPFTVSSAVRAIAPIPEWYVPGEIASVTAAASGGKITVSWSASVNTAAYIVQRRVKGGDTWTTLKSNVIGTSYTDTTGVPGTVYQYRVRGRNGTVYGPFKLSSVVRAAA